MLKKRKQNKRKGQTKRFSKKELHEHTINRSISKQQTKAKVVGKNMGEFEEKYLKKSNQYAIRVSKEMLLELEAEAEKRGVSVNRVINDIIEKNYLGKTVSEVMEELFKSRKKN